MYKLVVWQSMLPLFPWRYHFLPCVLGRKRLEPFLGVCPCCVCIREGHGGSTEQSQVMFGVRQDESMVWRPCQKAPPWSGWAFIHQLLRPWAQAGWRHWASHPVSSCFLHVLFSLQVPGDCPEGWQTCSQMRGLASFWAVLAGGPQGQAQTLSAGQEADARPWPGRGDTSWCSCCGHLYRRKDSDFCSLRLRTVCDGALWLTWPRALDAFAF